MRKELKNVRAQLVALQAEEAHLAEEVGHQPYEEDVKAPLGRALVEELAARVEQHAHLVWGIWGDVGRCGEIWGDVGRCGEM